MSGRPRRRSGQASRAGGSPRRGIRSRLPSGARILAILAFTAVVAGMVALLNGPWLRVAQVAHAGERFTPAGAVESVLAGYLDRPMLGLDSHEVAERLGALPTVADVEVTPVLPDRLTVRIREKAPAATWLTPTARLVLAADGTVIGAMPRNASLPPELEDVTSVYDTRPGSAGLEVGDAVSAAELRAAQRLLDLDPRLLGSRAQELAIRIDEEYGFVLLSADPSWRVAMGFYQATPGESEDAAVARLQAQVAAVRTLFAKHRERTVSWVDARNPGKVYWAP